jgi:arabinan endo-1,5-alpha-L-arabinosidase
MRMQITAKGPLGLWAALTIYAFGLLAGCNSSSTTSKLVATSITLNSSTASTNLNGSVTLTAQLTGSSSASAPIGIVTFFDGSSSLQAMDVTGKTSVTLTTASLTGGIHTLTAAYAGDQVNAPSVSSPLTFTVYVPTTTSVTASPNLANVDASVTLTAVVAGGDYSPTGTVSFTYGSPATALGSANITSVNGIQTASLVTTALPLGADAITATYAASSYFLGSTSPTATVTVHPLLINTTTTLASAPIASIASGTLTTLTATIVPASTGSAAPTGSVTFLDGTRTLGAVAIVGNTASFQTKQFAVGANTLTAVYSGDAVYNTSTSSPSTLTMSAYSGATYTNPLNIKQTISGTSYAVNNCPDPAIIKYQATPGVDTWYAYCTGDVLNATDNKSHLISILSSSDLINWTYVGDALSSLPAWSATGQELQTPAIKLVNGVYNLYYEVPSVAASPNGSAIGVATAATPAGPFIDSGTPVINQQLACGGTCNRTVFAPEIIADPTNGNALSIVYGGLFAGISIRSLSTNGLISNAASEINIGVDNYYQNPFIWYHDGYFYEFLTAGACCSGIYSTDNVHVGRSVAINGPYDDAEGNDLNAFSTPATQDAPGGDPALVMNGNDIVGAGSNTMFTDESGQDYMLYSGISQKQPYLPNYGAYNARQLMMDAVDWVNGWPRVRDGFGPSDYTTPQPVPAAQPNATNGYVTPVYLQDTPDTLMAAYSDDFNEPALNTSQWTFLHAPASYTMSGTQYVVQSAPDESVFLPTMQLLPILSESAPTGNYIVEIKVSTTSSPTAFYTTNQQAGLFIYSNDEDYLRLDEFPDFDTRQIEYLNQYGPGILGSGTSLFDYAFAPVGTPNFYGSTYLRIAHRVGVGTNGTDTYTAYSSTDGITYLTGPTWTASYGTTAKIGLFAGNTAGYTVSFDYIHVSSVQP